MVGGCSPFWSITESKYELEKDKSQVNILEYRVEDRSGTVAERPRSASVRLSWLTYKVHDYRGGEPERRCDNQVSFLELKLATALLTKRKPSKEHSGHVVYQLNVEEEHAEDIVATFVHSPKVHERIDTSGKGTVEPSSTLADEFWCTLGNVGFTL